jgi:hypothetical protein
MPTITPTRHVFSSGKHVAMIVKCSREADAYREGEPWTLLHDTGRVDRFASYKEAREESLKAYTAAAISGQWVDY